MAPVVVGEAVTVQWAPTEGSGTAATLAVVKPDGTTLSPAPTVTGTATFSATLTLADPGRHLLTWSRGTARLVDVLDVWPAAPRYLVSVDDAAAVVGSGVALAQAKRDELQLHIAAASAAVEDITGALVKTTFTAKRDGGRASVLLPALNVTVVTVTVDGTALAAGSYVVDEAAGVVYAGSQGFGAFPAGRQNVAVTYTVGDNLITPQVRLACLEQVKFLWQVQKQGATRDDLGYTPSGFGVPRMVAELCASVPSSRAPGFA